MDKPNQLPEILSLSVSAQSRLFTIEQVELKFSNGVERQYERMRSGGHGAVMVVPLLDEKTMLLIREYACGTHTYELGFVKGLIDPGETPEQAANRELQEEIGYGASKFTKLKSLAMAPTYFGSTMHIFIAEELYEQRLEGDEPEPLEVVQWPLAGIDNLMVQQDFNDARCVAALLMAQTRLAI
ncbi:ADP compounds hydrolase NudE [Psychrobium sp. 1_MG-2023]|uniref:ADP compounds hydrolase NudE n=1 Tax=Psychrobium sp. 1_MG-2023 TaxID=3062624 RepID=UPI000C337316|nr:ADP compounds hydrolase NudE [Psychrobium sp. 1_MG-2023]MDP2561942.1 ADP compounds hydrolase NudE [Psychrobium sp. 1_MG-2023]PKF58675.1 ADP compounds hydrolase NudE [Alteromonadales bacterium alter-6D02]